MPEWTHRFKWQWASSTDISKLLGVPYGLDMTTQDVDSFLVSKIDKKLFYGVTTGFNFTSRAIITNTVVSPYVSTS